MMRLYRAGLLLLPPRFRRAYGLELVDQARTRMEEATAGGRRPREAVRLAADLGRTILREWWDEVDQVMRGLTTGLDQDLRWAVRSVVRTPVFAASVVGILGLGIGATTVAFGLVEAWLLRSLPYPEGERLMAVWPSENWSREMVELAADGLPSLEGVAGVGGMLLVLQEGPEPEELFASHVTTNLLDVLGVGPVLGRGFVASDGVPGAEPVAILSYRLWLERFGGDAGVLGRAIALGGEGHRRRTVIGVMPESHVPIQGSTVDAWVPVVVDRAADGYDDSYFMSAIGRLGPGARPEDAARDVRAWSARLGELHPEWFDESRVRGATALPIGQVRSSDRRTAILVAFGAALLVLLVACANVANLVVARTTSRERELSVRSALGGGRLRAARTVLAETVLLGLTGALLGFVLAVSLKRALELWLPAALPSWGLAAPPELAAAAAALGMLAALVAGLLPAVQAARGDPARAMSGGRGSVGRRRLTRVQELLSATQLAMATAGIAAMGLLGRSLLEIARVDPGMEGGNAVVFRVTAPVTSYPEDADVARFFREARAALALTPGVESVGFGSRLPLAGGDSRISVEPEGHEFVDGQPRPVAWHRLITPGYLEALGARLLDGRFPTARDDGEGMPQLVVINRAAAETYWPGESAVGKRFGGPDNTVWLTVAGVVADVKENGQTQPVLPGLYIPHRDWPWRTMYAVVRTRSDALSLVPALKQALWSVAGGVPVSRVETLERVIDRGLRPTRMLAVLAGLAGGVTLLLGALGIYAVISHAVARRMRELGVRSALGADRWQLLRGELSGATRIVVIGLGAGLILAWLAGSALRGALFGVGALDVPSLGATLLLLGAVAYAAAFFPARRASVVSPASVMRED